MPHPPDGGHIPTYHFLFLFVPQAWWSWSAWRIAWTFRRSLLRNLLKHRSRDG